MYSSVPWVLACETTWGTATRPTVMSVIAGAPVARKSIVIRSSAGKRSG